LYDWELDDERRTFAQRAIALPSPGRALVVLER
jgi:hypothetical protein